MLAVSVPSGRTTSVRFATANNTAVAPGDYTAASGSLGFPALTTAGVVRVRATGDTVAEPDETLKVLLSAPTFLTIAEGSAWGVVVNDD